MLKSIHKVAHPEEHSHRKSNIVHTPIDWSKHPPSAFRKYSEPIEEENEEEDEEHRNYEMLSHDSISDSAQGARKDYRTLDLAKSQQQFNFQQRYHMKQQAQRQSEQQQQSEQQKQHHQQQRQQSTIFTTKNMTTLTEEKISRKEETKQQRVRNYSNGINHLRNCREYR